MKKITLVIFALLTSLLTFSQSDSGDFTVAPTVGVNISSYYSSQNLTFNSRVSLAGGVIAEYYFNDRWSLRSGLSYDTKGVKDSFDFTDKLSYLTIPAQANWHFGTNRNWYLNFGTAFSFLIAAKFEDPDGNTGDIKDALKSFDLGVALGIGHKFTISDNFQLYIDYQGLGGLLDIVNFDNNGVDLKNSRNSFNVGGIFHL